MTTKCTDSKLSQSTEVKINAKLTERLASKMQQTTNSGCRNRDGDEFLFRKLADRSKLVGVFGSCICRRRHRKTIA